MITNKKIMIVDDDEDDMDFFCEAVQEIDATFSCMTAINGEDALTKLRQAANSPPDYIFLDLNMPRMNGKNCLRELKKDHNLKGIPVIIYTTSSLYKEKEEMLRLGAAHFLTKAVTFEHIRKGIEEALRAVSSIGRSKKILGR